MKSHYVKYNLLYITLLLKWKNLLWPNAMKNIYIIIGIGSKSYVTADCKSKMTITRY